MCDLCFKCKSIEWIYLQKVFEEFLVFNQVQFGKFVLILDIVFFDSFSLVQNEELEEFVVVDVMVVWVMSCDVIVLVYLSICLNILVGWKVDEKSNFFVLCLLIVVFFDVCQGFGVEIKVKLIIFKLFEKYVLVYCDQLYVEVNQILVVVGVLLEFKFVLLWCQFVVCFEVVCDVGILQVQVVLFDGGQQEVFGVLQELLVQVCDNFFFYCCEMFENVVLIFSNDLMCLFFYL